MENSKIIDEAVVAYERPYIIQGSPAPAFRGNDLIDVSFQCVSCGHPLIENYFPECYAQIGVRGFVCEHVSWTPEVATGEVLGVSIVNLGDKGRFLIGSTVNVPRVTVLSHDYEIKRVHSGTAPRYCASQLNLSPEGLAGMVAAYDDITGGKLERQRKIVDKTGVSSIKTFPFVWAIIHLEKWLDKGSMQLSDSSTATAIMWVHLFQHVLGTWRHHPRFAIIARDLGKPKSFLHTTAQLTAAAYLYSHGSRVGLTLENKRGEANPDLYIPGVGDGKLYLEVKAPEDLQWGGGSVTTERIDAVVESQIKRSSDQINRAHRGILILSSSYASSEFPTQLEQSIKKGIANRGRNHRHLAAVVGMSPTELQIHQGGGTMSVSQEFSFSVTLNPNFEGPNPVRRD